MKRKVIIAAATATVLVGGGAATAVGVTSANGGDQDSKAPSTSSDVRGSDDAKEAADPDDAARDDAARKADGGKGGLSVRQASAAVLKATPGTVTELELDTEDNRLVWEADVLTERGAWHKVEIDAATGKVVKNHVNHEDGSRGNAPRAPKLDAAAAAEKAASVTKGSVTSVDLERNGSRWEVDTVGKNGTEHELDLDATTGKVLKHESEKADDDHGDDRDD